MTSGQRGISIVELLAVVTILGILAAIVTPVAQVVITREVELGLMRHLRGIRRGIDTYHEIAVKCWDDSCKAHGLHTVNRKDQERCRKCNQLLAGVMCTNCNGWNSRSMQECQWCAKQGFTVPMTDVLCPNTNCGKIVQAIDIRSGHYVQYCPECGANLELYRENPLTNYPTSFQDMYMLNTLRLSHAYNPVTAGREHWDITLFRPPGVRTFDLRVDGVRILEYMDIDDDGVEDPSSGTVINGYPRKDGTNGLLREGNGYILEAWEWKGFMTGGQFDLDKWKASMDKYNISIYDNDHGGFKSFSSIISMSPEVFAGVSGTGTGTGATGGQTFLPQIYDVHFPINSKRNKATLDGKKVYSDL